MAKAFITKTSITILTAVEGANMKNLNILFNVLIMILLLPLLFVGASIVFSMDNFYLSMGADTNGLPQLISHELRAMGFIILASGCLLLSSTVYRKIQKESLFLITFIYLAIAIGRIFSVTSYGLPSDDIILILIIELILGFISLFLYKKVA